MRASAMSKAEHIPHPWTAKNSWNKIAAGSVTESRYNLPRAVYWQSIARPTFCRGGRADYAPQSRLAKFIRSLIRRDKLAYHILSAEEAGNFVDGAGTFTRADSCDGSAEAVSIDVWSFVTCSFSHRGWYSSHIGCF
jgi:hypothetical protein